MSNQDANMNNKIQPLDKDHLLNQPVFGRFGVIQTLINKINEIITVINSLAKHDEDSES